MSIQTSFRHYITSAGLSADLKNALLLSGGIDSISLAYWLRPSICITIDYGQRPAKGEFRSSAAVTSVLNIPHIFVKADCGELGSGDLAGTSPLNIAPQSEWWPYRNQYLITIAAMRLIKEGVNELIVGTVKNDEFHADGRPEFVDTISRLLSAQEGNIQVAAPAINMTSAELVIRSKIPLNILSYSHSCHVSEYACGKCRGCAKHYETLQSLGHEPY